MKNISTYLLQFLHKEFGVRIMIKSSPSSNIMDFDFICSNSRFIFLMKHLFDLNMHFLILYWFFNHHMHSVGTNSKIQTARMERGGSKTYGGFWTQNEQWNAPSGQCQTAKILLDITTDLIIFSDCHNIDPESMRTLQQETFFYFFDAKTSNTSSSLS